MTVTAARPDASGPVQDATWHRLNARMLLVHPIMELGRALPALVGVLLAGSGSHRGSWWVLIAAAAVAAFSLTRWFTTRLRITAEHVQLRHGLLRRRTITASRDRIRTVDVTSHLLHRLLGLARVVVGTGTNDRKGEGRIVLDGLSAPAARALRDELLHRRPPLRDPVLVGAPADAGTRQADSDAAVLATIDRRWVRYAPFTLSGVVTGLVIWGFYTRVQSESQVDLLRSGPLRAIARGLARLPTATEVAVVVVALLAFVAVTSTVGYVLAFWNFRLVRHPGGTLQVTRGLLTTRATSIERRRLVGATISEPLVLRAVGGARTLAVATGLRTGRGAERGGEVLLPPAPRDVAVAVASAALDATPALRGPLVEHGRAARRRRLVRAVCSGLVLLAVAMTGWLTGGSGWPVAIAVVLLPLTVPLGTDRFRGLGHGVIDGYLVTRAGSVVRRRTALRADAVIGWNVRSTPFQRRVGLSTITATTAAGAQAYRVLDIDTPAALELARAVSPGLLDQFIR